MSPAATHERDAARTLLLEAAEALFYRRGIANVTMAEIRDQAGVSLRRIYDLYPAKSDLVAGWLRQRHDEWLAWFTTDVGARIDAGAAPIDAIFDALGSWLAATDRRGCAFLNTLAETTDLTDEHRAIIRDHKIAAADVLAAYSPDPAAVAVLVDGAIVRAAAIGTIEPVEAARRAATRLTAA